MALRLFLYTAKVLKKVEFLVKSTAKLLKNQCIYDQDIYNQIIHTWKNNSTLNYISIQFL